jgi:DNA-binding response OmpR family regulator
VDTPGREFVQRRVLVVEDSPVIQRLIEICLRPAGFDVVGATEGYVALATAAAAPPDLVVLDVGLPDISGWEVLAGLRSAEATRDVTVLMLTADGREETERTADALGADAFLTKPFRPNDLREVCLRLVGPSTLVG